MRPRRDAEHGFVLIGVVWLLLLGTALVAILMSRGRGEAMTASAEGKLLQAKLDRDAAAQTVIADLTINGPRSRWWRLPATGAVQIGARSVQVKLSGENGRLDLNDGDSVIIDGALQAAGYSARNRARFIAALTSKRAEGRIDSAAEAEALLEPLREGGGPCPTDMFTFVSGMPRPSFALSNSDESQAGGSADESSREVHPGDALRIEIGGVTTRETVVFRVMSVGPSPFAIATRFWSGC